MRVLDAGCGVGEPAREMARFAGVKVTGVSINESHVRKAKTWTKDDGLDHLVDFVEGDFMVGKINLTSRNTHMNADPAHHQHLPFPNSTFDIVYSIEATVYAPDLAACYAELYRVLKPGGVFGTYEWHLTDKFSPENPHHVDIRQRIERGNGVTNLLAVPGGLDAMRAVGFEVLHHEDMAQRGDKVPWWYPIDADTSKTTCWSDWWRVFRLNKKVWRVANCILWVCESLGVCPKGTLESAKVEGMGVFAYREAAKVRQELSIRLDRLDKTDY